MPWIRRHGTKFALLAIVLVGAALRLYGLGAESLWADELITAHFVTTMTAPELLVGIPQTQPHPPLYYVLLRFWIQLFGTSAVAMRALSALFGIATIPVVYALGRRLVDEQVGLIAAALFALTENQLHFGQDVRMYSLLVLFTVASFYALVAFYESPTRRTAGLYGALVVLMVSTHYFGLFVVCAQVTYLVFRARSLVGDAVLGVPTRIVQAAYGLLVLASPLLVRAATAGVHVPRLAYIPYPTPKLVVGMYTGYFGYSGGTMLPVVLLALVVYVGVSALAVLRPRFPERILTLPPRVSDLGVEVGTPDRNATLLAVLWLAIPFGLVLALSYLVTPIFYPRYVVVAAGGAYLLAAIGIRNVPRPSLRTVLVFVVLLSLVPSGYLYYSQVNNAQYRSAVHQIDAAAHPGDEVIVGNSYSYAIPYYSNRSDLTTTGISMHKVNVGKRSGPLSRVKSASSSHDRVWLVLAHINRSNRGRFLTVVNKSHHLAEHKHYFGVDLYLYERSGTKTNETRSSDASTHPLTDGRRRHTRQSVAGQ